VSAWTGRCPASAGAARETLAALLTINFIIPALCPLPADIALTNRNGWLSGWLF
jgi:hypothetical protein